MPVNTALQAQFLSIIYPWEAGAAGTELFLQMALSTALSKGVCCSHSHQGPHNVPHPDKNNQALPPLLLLLVFKATHNPFLFLPEKLDYFMMATGIPSLILPDIDSTQTPVFQNNVGKTAL